MSVKVTSLPYIAPRKARGAETSRFVVKWIQGDTLYFRWYKRDKPACKFLNKILDMGLEARILMK